MEALAVLHLNSFPATEANLGLRLDSGSFFINSAVNGNFEDYIVTELRSYVNSKYRTKTGRKSTAIAGHSMGAYAAILLSLRHPDVYSLVTAHTPSTIVAMAPQVFSPSFYNDVLNEIPGSGQVLPTNGRATYMLYALSAALSPNLANAPFQVSLPIEIDYTTYIPVIVNGQLVPDTTVLNQWLVYDPYTIVQQNNSFPGCLYIDYGKQETVINTNGVQLFEGLLSSLNIGYKSAVCAGTSFAQADYYTPSNDLAEALVHPALLETAFFVDPYTPYPAASTTAGTLWNFIVAATKMNSAQADAITLANFGAFITGSGPFLCHQTLPPTTAALLNDINFLNCLNTDCIDPTGFLNGFFSIPGYVAIDPRTFSVDTDGFLGCCEGCGTSVNCPSQLFLSFKKCKKRK